MNETIILDTEDKKLSIEYLYNEEEYHTMTFKVESKGFKGKSNFCISKDDLLEILEKIESIITELRGSIEIRDRDSDANICVTLGSLGQLVVHGQIGGSYEDHFLKFKFDSDQTILNKFRDFFKRELF
ncbi:WapI family immunity protein [Lysinibacillus fusiformis]|uniref:WapI family immunity protein n=1 Tax=Lysinibacillus fusiformis TaxID=28031 RepID=UPI0037229968